MLGIDEAKQARNDGNDGGQLFPEQEPDENHIVMRVVTRN